jgi:FlaA1/EpsC-like NDP-sugar epimerase
MFATDLAAHRGDLQQALSGARIVVVGAAGSIGSAVVRQLVEYPLGTLVLADLSENDLVELVRDLRSSPDVQLPEDFAARPIGLGNPEFDRSLASYGSGFDYFFNLAALKHVRSEKDVYSLTRMVDTNVLFLNELLGKTPCAIKKLFSVSSDKAVAPSNLMGATKMVMEQVLLLNSPRRAFSSARFANVAFSQGSLPHGFLHRMAKRQPLAAPSDIKRYFISHEEAGQLCLLAAVMGHNGDVFFPRLREELHERSFADIARGLLALHEYTPVECATAENARESCEKLIAKGEWPCHFAPSDTTGEKPFEEFVAPDDQPDLERFQAVGVIPRSPEQVDRPALEAFLQWAYGARQHGATKAEYVEQLKNVVPTLRHEELDRNLDQKM